MSSALAISWSLSTISGYGIYGLEIAMQFLRRGGQQVILTGHPAISALPPLVELQMAPILALGKKVSQHLEANPNERLTFKHAALHACGNDFSGFTAQDRVWGEPNVGCAAIEQLVSTQSGRAIAGNYHYFLAISKWNEAFLKSLNVGPVYLCHQGIDGTLFQPGPKNGLWRHRFVVFSGGKFEFRKGQDIVVAAFKRFHARHPEALLITCWQNLLMPDEEAFAQAGHIGKPPQKAPQFGLQITPFLLAEGLPEGSFIDLPFTHNLLMPTVLRECDVAIFPNRCEGGTNLVAMEAMACGIPTYVAYNTGQKDLVDLLGCGAFYRQRPVEASSHMQSAADWGESDVDEVVDTLERAYAHHADELKKAALTAEAIRAWHWSHQNERLLKLVCDGHWEGSL